jgi:membrane associated rhomboid family serine protease
MTPTPVGMRCPECSRDRTKVKSLRTMTTEPRVTYALIAINVIAFLASGQFGFGSNGGGTTLWNKGALFGPAVHDGHDYWRLVTSGFLHAGLLHIAFNMYLLYLLGQMLEPALGSWRFGVLYMTSLLAGSFGALVVSPHSVTVGASGAVFGLMGAAFAEQRRRGIDPFQTGIGGLIAINLVFSFAFSGISIGGHIGGLIGGVLAGAAFELGDRNRLPALGYAACLVLAAGCAVGGYVAAGSSGL